MTPLPDQPLVFSCASVTVKWRHFNRKADGVRDALGDIDPIILDALLQEDTRPRATRFSDGLLINLRGVNHNDGAEPEDMVAVRIWADGDTIITLAALPIRAIEDLDRRFQSATPPSSPCDVVTFIAQRLAFRIESVVIDLDTGADRLEEEIDTADATQLSADATALRQRVLGLRRHLLPQREALSALIREPEPLFTQESIFSLRETLDTLMRLNEDLDTIRERLQVVREQLAERRASDMNQRLFVLAIVSAVFLPLSFITGLLGVNVGGVPGTDNPWAFIVLCAAMVLSAIAIYIAFKKMKWI